MKKEYESYYHAGTKPIPDTKFKVYTVKNNEFVYLGTVDVPGKLVSKEMDDHKSIKGYTPECIAKKLAREKWPKANPVIVVQIVRR